MSRNVNNPKKKKKTLDLKTAATADVNLVTFSFDINS